MKSKKKISVCICTYNGEQFLEEQLVSICTQTIIPDEIVVCDDHSTDSTPKIIHSYMNKYPQIEWKIYINENNVGWRTNFRNAIEYSSGDVIFLCDQDDVWKKDKVETFMNFFNNERSGLISSYYEPLLMDGAKEKLKSSSCDTRTLSKYTCSHKSFYYRAGCTFAFTRDIADDFLLCWRKEFAHDNLLWYISLIKNSLFCLDYGAILFRRHSSNASSFSYKKISKKSSFNIYTEIDLHIQILEILLEKLSIDDRFSKLVKRQISWLKTRKRLYESRNIFVFIKLFFYISYYSSLNNYFRDINAILYGLGS